MARCVFAVGFGFGWRLGLVGWFRSFLGAVMRAFLTRFGWWLCRVVWWLWGSGFEVVVFVGFDRFLLVVVVIGFHGLAI